MIVSAGSSAGTRDFTADVIAELGEVLIHGVAIKPGKPVIIGRVDGRPVIGLPGYPLSALTVLRELVIPLLAHFGLPVPPSDEVGAALASPLTKEVGADEFVLLAVGRVGERWVAVPQSRGAGVQMSVVRSNAYLRVPARSEGIEADEEVAVRLTVPRSDAERALLVTGSHDPAIDVLADLLSARGDRPPLGPRGLDGRRSSPSAGATATRPRCTCSPPTATSTSRSSGSTCPTGGSSSSAWPNGSRGSSRATASGSRRSRSTPSRTGSGARGRGCSSTAGSASTGSTRPRSGATTASSRPTSGSRSP